MPARKKTAPAAPPAPVLEAYYSDDLRAVGLTVMVFGNYTTPNPAGGSFWHPEIITGSDGALIVWRHQYDPHNNYSFDGYQVQLGPHQHGGTHRTLAGALGWLLWARDVRDGKRATF
jgi:hypothetical protein